MQSFLCNFFGALVQQVPCMFIMRSPILEIPLGYFGPAVEWNFVGKFVCRTCPLACPGPWGPPGPHLDPETPSFFIILSVVFDIKTAP